MKIKWKVQEAPTGRYRSFHHRGWPIAEFENGSYAATLYCVDDYIPRRVKQGDHAPLVITVALHGKTVEGHGLITASLKKRAETLIEAKALVAAFYKAHPEHVPNALV